MPKPNAYIICTSPRSGSTLFCAMLRDGRVAGDPQSLFHRDTLSAWRRGLNLLDDTPLADILRAAKKRGMAETGMFGLRLQRHSAPFFLEQMSAMYPDEPSDTARIDACFGTTRYIYLHRRDKVAQAVSLVRAQQSGLWHRNADGTELERIGPGQALHYNEIAISKAHEDALNNECAWMEWFHQEGITPLEITYESLAEDPLAQFRRAISFLDIDPSNAAVVTPRLSKLADETSAAWIAQFRGNSCAK